MEASAVWVHSHGGARVDHVDVLHTMPQKSQAFDSTRKLGALEFCVILNAHVLHCTLYCSPSVLDAETVHVPRL